MVIGLRKIFYVPGLISLVCFPFLLLIVWTPKEHKDFRVLKMNLPSAKKDEGGIMRFSDESFRKEVFTKKAISFEMKSLYWDSATISYKSAYEELDRKINEFFHKNDTLSVLDISFAKQNSYGEFIWLDNKMLVHNFKRYAFLDNHFYVFANPPPVNRSNEILLPVFECGTVGAQQIIEIEISQKKYTRLSDWFEYLFSNQKQNRQLALGFLLLIVIPAIAQIGRGKRKGTFYCVNECQLRNGANVTL